MTDFGSCWVQGSCLDSGRFCDDARLWPSHLPRVTQITFMLGHRSVRQSSGGCPLSRVGHVGVEDRAKNPGESRQVITAIVQYVWTRSSLEPNTIVCIVFGPVLFPSMFRHVLLEGQSGRLPCAQEYRLLAWKSLLGYIVNDHGAKQLSCSGCVARAQHDGEGLP